jgi:transcriptional regulator with XRE-family HTH domain
MRFMVKPYAPRSTTAAGILANARLKAGLTQRELAARAGVNQSWVARIESGRAQPTLESLERLLGAAGYELRYHLERRDDHDRVLAARAVADPERHAAQRADIERWRGIALRS